MARSIGRSMAALVATERHLWLILSNIKGKDKNFIIDAPLSPSGLYGDAVNSVVERFQESAKQADAFEKLRPIRTYPLEVEWLRPHFMVPIFLRYPQGTGLPTLPSRVLQGAAVNGECISQSPHGNLVAFGCPPPLRRISDRSVQTHPAGSPFQDVILSAQIHINPETSLERLVPLVEFLTAWELLSNISHWVLQTIEKGYQIQFGSCPPRFMRGLSTEVAPQQVLVMEQEVKSLLEKGAIEYVPHSNRETVFYSRYFIVPNKDGGLLPILDLRVLNDSVRQLKFKILTLKQIVPQIRSEDWFVTIDLKDAYLPKSILPCHRRTHMKELGLRLNAKKSVLSQLKMTTFLGVVWDSTLMQGRLSPARTESILSAVKSIRLGQSLTVKQFQRLLGLMAADSNMIPFGLLYMRPLHWWLRTKGFSPRGNPFRMIKVTRRCSRAWVMWKKPWFLSQGPVLGPSCRRRMLTTDASLTGWGVILEGWSSQCVWKDRCLTWYINRLEMLAVFLALKNLLANLRGHHVLVHSDNTSVVSYINHQGDLRSCPLCKLACQILLWSQGKLLSLRAAYILGIHNIGADILSRQGLRPREWRLHPEVVELMHKWSGKSGSACVSRDISLSTLVLPHASSSSRTRRDGADVAEASFGVLARSVHCRANPVYFGCLCGGHKRLPHSFGWNIIGERPPGISFPTWYFEAEACSSHLSADMGSGYCPARPFPGSLWAFRVGACQIFDLKSIVPPCYLIS